MFCYSIELYTVTFRPRSTSVAGTVSNAEGFACCCRAANDEDGYWVGAGQGFELTAVAVGHLGRNATWRQSTLGLFTNRSLLRRTTGAVDTSGLPCLTSRLMDEWVGAAVISFERLGFRSNPATNLGTGEVSKRSNLCITVSRTSRVSTCAVPTAPMFSCTAPISAWAAPMSACITAMDSLFSAFIASIDFVVSAWAAPLSACIAPVSSKSKPTAEPGRERRDEEVDQFDPLEERPDLVPIL